ncbi:hypothetical protein FSP39_021147 [Pinctada imbricata]|uniref:Transcriptional coactivator p15 (PC4) C-terminal domain-containing protein n=1 Tax=Pinctada imbricata TaxID=66713 RepID=A0AA89CB46_PINIB|nr:hypothetical protein FSP39_021147 [Pinctada imbricata]
MTGPVQTSLEKTGPRPPVLSECQSDSSGDNIYVLATAGRARTVLHWLMLECYAGQIDKVFETLVKLKPVERQRQQWHLGNDIYVTVDDAFPLLDIRRYWKPEDQYVPTTKGVKLTMRRWESLKNCTAVIRDFVPNLKFAATNHHEDSNDSQLPVDHIHLSDLQCDC